jgi:hypothetical protein
MFISSAPISRNGTLAQISRAVNADLTVSAGLHCAFIFWLSRRLDSPDGYLADIPQSDTPLCSTSFQ